MLKRQLIMEKASELFAEKGFEATSIQQITDHCGISKGAFYLSFKSKDELVVALIDHFMMQMISTIDHIVRNTPDDRLLYEFYYAIYHTFQKHSDFAKILIKEQAHTFNNELMVKMSYYDKVMENLILSMIERLYGDEAKQIKYDLIYCIKGFMNTYSQLFIFYNVPIDLDTLAKSLAEKTNLIAKHAGIPFITKDLAFMFNQPKNEEVTKEAIVEMIKQKIEEMEDSIEKESLILLKRELLEPSLSRAIVKGLIENLQSHSHCQWISYLLRKQFQF
ncbi:TetR/AcrR family transcriptional regulator [Neobacillus notoginsengisoli]|uniref:TetR/AcrR family transcriptional regulator n=1 Tax=Neobacillus notoginsengisoli TaxID=1578198 RepID=A0A417YY09_9BACI|nr:TetR/AcrR family transcriptional regulator [Neobacillus notoginsengisoli]RHW42611.1 TetR/AcrR family transcriptional regulator [Neobacillus notoginsengisoli]